MSAIVEVDEKGRVLIPAEFRKKMKSSRFKLTAHGNVLELEALEGVEALRGKFRHTIKHDWDELEEMGEEFVTRR